MAKHASPNSDPPKHLASIPQGRVRCHRRTTSFSASPCHAPSPMFVCRGASHRRRPLLWLGCGRPPAAHMRRLVDLGATCVASNLTHAQPTPALHPFSCRASPLRELVLAATTRDGGARVVAFRPGELGFMLIRPLWWCFSFILHLTPLLPMLFEFVATISTPIISHSNPESFFVLEHVNNPWQMITQ